MELKPDMSFISLIDEIIEMTNNYRSIARMLDKSLAFELWNLSTEQEKEVLIEAVTNRDREKVQAWVKNHAKMPTRMLTIKQLYKKAQRLKIHNYSRIPTMQLIQDIENAEARKS